MKGGFSPKRALMNRQCRYMYNVLQAPVRFRDQALGEFLVLGCSVREQASANSLY